MCSFQFWVKLSLMVYMVTLNHVTDGIVWFFGYEHLIISKKLDSSINYMI